MTGWLFDHKMRKMSPDLGWPVYLIAVDENSARVIAVICARGSPGS
jgi:hypothetical protein